MQELLLRHGDYLRGVNGGKRADLRGKFLQNIKVQKGRLRDSLLSGCDFTGSDMTGTDFSNSDCFGAVFRRAKLGGANFFKADIRGVKFTGSILRGADFRDADMRPGDIRDNKMERAQSVDPSDAVLDNANLARANRLRAICPTRPKGCQAVGR